MNSMFDKQVYIKNTNNLYYKCIFKEKEGFSVTWVSDIKLADYWNSKKDALNRMNQFPEEFEDQLVTTITYYKR